MENNVSLNISIDSSVENIWQILVDEQAFNECFENVKMTCNEWKVGEVIKFESDKNNQILIDEAIITSIYNNERLRYSYKKENTNHEIEVTFSLKPSGNFTYLTVEGKGFINEFERFHSENTWINMMQAIKKYVQKK
ncbi:SRPBCC domain-containing protein [Empedobacter tilapiae]|uniref:Activator of Hsp90 ATPase homologue 1/2-like C-terminal domain-containing protein n=1 Tax=Empedobacter tilapiae TaxID=2491114 RepID=A0A4Z1AWW6_9FLAO|nr:SRPBCC domain-containing protein [Empedobacter tilapiae]TGN24503.1 hypothetical protein E4J94_12695 [Empedobacter tilapiae]